MTGMQLGQGGYATAGVESTTFELQGRLFPVSHGALSLARTVGDIL